MEDTTTEPRTITRETAEQKILASIAARFGFGVAYRRHLGAAASIHRATDADLTAYLREHVGPYTIG